MSAVDPILAYQQLNALKAKIGGGGGGAAAPALLTSMDVPTSFQPPDGWVVANNQKLLRADWPELSAAFSLENSVISVAVTQAGDGEAPKLYVQDGWLVNDRGAFFWWFNTGGTDPGPHLASEQVAPASTGLIVQAVDNYLLHAVIKNSSGYLSLHYKDTSNMWHEFVYWGEVGLPNGQLRVTTYGFNPTVRVVNSSFYMFCKPYPGNDSLYTWSPGFNQTSTQPLPVEDVNWSNNFGNPSRINCFGFGTAMGLNLVGWGTWGSAYGSYQTFGTDWPFTYFADAVGEDGTAYPQSWFGHGTQYFQLRDTWLRDTTYQHFGDTVPHVALFNFGYLHKGERFWRDKDADALTGQPVRGEAPMVTSPSGPWDNEIRNAQINKVVGSRWPEDLSYIITMDNRLLLSPDNKNWFNIDLARFLSPADLILATAWDWFGMWFCRDIYPSETGQAGGSILEYWLVGDGGLKIAIRIQRADINSVEGQALTVPGCQQIVIQSEPASSIPGTKKIVYVGAQAKAYLDQTKAG